MVLSDEHVNVNNLPTVITEAFNKINDISKNIQKLSTAAANAKAKADEASQKKPGWSLWGDKKEEAIKALQDATINQAEVLSSFADVNQQLFDNQSKMAESIKYLFYLGVTNMAANRTVVRELELKLKNASEEELSELARKELTNVLLQLRAQEDLYNRLANHDNLFRGHNLRIQSLENFKNEELSKRISQLRAQEDLYNRLDNYDNLFKDHNLRIQSLEDNIFDSKTYKIIIGIIAIIALVLSIINIIL